MMHKFLPLVVAFIASSICAQQLRRPQTPERPYPYREENIKYENEAARITFAATFTVPPGDGPFPAVVLITGSGPQDRDESIRGHKPFLVLADYLTRNGIAVLRADDRGVGESGGDFDQATTADFATDVEAGIRYLKTRTEVDAYKIGLVGHSEGALIAPMVASRNPDVAFIVMLAGTGVRGDSILPAQVAAEAESGGQTHAEAMKLAAYERKFLQLIGEEKDDAIVEKKLREESVDGISHARFEAQIKQLRSPWWQFFLAYDPAIALMAVKCPVLALNGELDRQVLSSQNLSAIRNALEAGGNRNFEVEELPSLNHLFQTANTGHLRNMNG